MIEPTFLATWKSLLSRLRRRSRRFLRPTAADKWTSMQGRRSDFVFSLTKSTRMRLYLDSRLCEYIYCGDFEANERQFTQLFLRSGDIYVDVGANIGLFSLLAAECVGARGQVIAFEPAPQTYQRLLDNITLNRYNQIQAHAFALSFADADLQMAISDGEYDGWNSLATPYMGNSFRSQLVHTTTWDSFAEDNNLVGRVALMKIDVEGWESNVLEGGANCLSRDDAPVLIIEFTEDAARSAGFSCEQLYDRITSLGYKLYRFEAIEKKLAWEPPGSKYPYQNLVATKSLASTMQRLKNDLNISDQNVIL